MVAEWNFGFLHSILSSQQTRNLRLFYWRLWVKKISSNKTKNIQKAGEEYFDVFSKPFEGFSLA